MKPAFLCWTLLFWISLLPGAQTWRSELYPNTKTAAGSRKFYSDKMIQDFSFAGYHRGEQEPPYLQKGIIDVSQPPYRADLTGREDVTALLQQAIDDAGSRGGGVVYLPAGTYRLQVPEGKNHCLRMDRSRVVLRGAGAGKTFLFNATTDMRGKAMLKIGSDLSWTSVPGKVPITRDLPHAATVIPVTSTAGFKKGDAVIVRNTITNDWIEAHGMLPYWKDKGLSLGGLLYCREVVAVDAKKKTLTLDTPIRYALQVAHDAAVYRAPPMPVELGVEDLSIGNRQISEGGDWSEESYTREGNPSYQCHDSWAIAMTGVSDSWIRNVSSYRPEGNTTGAHLLSNGIRLTHTVRVTLSGCHFSRPQFGGGGGNGYMYRVMGNETLLQDCVAEFSRHGFVLSGMAASGNVFLRCLDKNSGRQTGGSGEEKTAGSGSDHHMHFSHSNLFDQCRVENSYFAAGWRKWGGSTIHGLTGAHSVYWNLQSNGTQAYAVETQQGRYGYVIGTSGNKPAVRTSAWEPGTERITDPVDHTEGLGKGAGLVPQSLYRDQLEERRRIKSRGKN